MTFLCISRSPVARTVAVETGASGSVGSGSVVSSWISVGSVAGTLAFLPGTRKQAEMTRMSATAKIAINMDKIRIFFCGDRDMGTS